jgi:hypothetical protein
MKMNRLLALLANLGDFLLVNLARHVFAQTTLLVRLCLQRVERSTELIGDGKLLEMHYYIV